MQQHNKIENPISIPADNVWWGQQGHQAVVYFLFSLAIPWIDFQQSPGISSSLICDESKKICNFMKGLYSKVYFKLYLVILASLTADLYLVMMSSFCFTESW